jgi:hypothetical protein
MARFHALVSTPLTPAETFDYLASFSSASQWDPAVRTAEPLDAGPAGSGSRFRLTVSVLGVRLRLVYTITTFRRPDEVVLEARHWLLAAKDTIQVSSGADGTVVSYQAEARFRGPIRVLQPVLTAAFPRVALRAVAGLSDALCGSRGRVS